MSGFEFHAQEALNALTGVKRALADETASNIAGRIATNVFKKAFDNLSGPRIAPKDRRNPGIGGWPVPVRTGHLRRSLFMKLRIEPGVAYVGNSAAYAGAIEKGRVHRGALGGVIGMRRPFLSAPAKEFLGLAPRFADEELKKTVDKYGLE